VVLVRVGRWVVVVTRSVVVVIGSKVVVVVIVVIVLVVLAATLAELLAPLNDGWLVHAVVVSATAVVAHTMWARRRGRGVTSPRGTWVRIATPPRAERIRYHSNPVALTPGFTPRPVLSRCPVTPGCGRASTATGPCIGTGGCTDSDPFAPKRRYGLSVVRLRTLIAVAVIAAALTSGCSSAVDHPGPVPATPLRTNDHPVVGVRWDNTDGAR
jgi:hypothetical protein